MKKIIAKEFLILILSIFIGLICYISIYPYNYLKQSKINDLANQLNKKDDSLAKNIFTLKYNSKLNFYQSYYSKYTYYNYNEFWSRLEFLAEKDSIDYKWNKVWDKDLIIFFNENGFKTSKELSDYIISKRFNEQEKKQKIVNDKMYNERKTLYQVYQNTNSAIMDSKEQIHFTLNVFKITLLILFGLRFLYTAIIWSIKTLKS